MDLSESMRERELQEVLIIEVTEAAGHPGVPRAEARDHLRTAVSEGHRSAKIA